MMKNIQAVKYASKLSVLFLGLGKRDYNFLGSKLSVQVALVLNHNLATYLAKADAVDPQMDVLEWWKDNAEDLPNWSCAAKKVVPTQPSFGTAGEFFHF